MTKKKQSDTPKKDQERPKKKLEVEKESVELDDGSLDDAAGGAYTRDCASAGCDTRPTANNCLAQ